LGLGDLKRRLLELKHAVALICCLICCPKIQVYMNFDLSLGAGLDKPSFFEVAAHERVVPTLYAAFEHAITVRAKFRVLCAARPFARAPPRLGGPVATGQLTLKKLVPMSR